LNFSKEFKLILENIRLEFLKNASQNDFFILVSQGFSLELNVENFKFVLNNLIF